MSKLTRAYRWVMEFCATTGNVVSSIALAIMVMLITVSVVMRYILGNPIWITEDLSVFLMVIMLYLGLAYTFKQGGHIRITFIGQRLPPRVFKVLEAFAGIAGLLFAVLLTLQVFPMIRTTYRLNSLTETAELPMFPPQLILGIGLIFFIVWLLPYSIAKIQKVFAPESRAKEEERPASGLEVKESLQE